MLKDFHYYAVAVLARAAGFNEQQALVMAYASQYVNDSQDGGPMLVSGGWFPAQATAHRGFRSFSNQASLQVYIPFHYLPCTPVPHKAGQFATQPDSPLARLVLQQALAESPSLLRLCRVGVALHAFADSWAHQGFSGLLDPMNSINNMVEFVSLTDHKPLSTAVTPAIGHSQARCIPDLPYLKWGYRSGPDSVLLRRNNLALFIAAAQAIYGVLEQTSPNPRNAVGWTALVDRLAGTMTMASKNEGHRCRVWMKEFRNFFSADDWQYDATAWRRQAIERTEGFMTWKKDGPYITTPIYAWRGDPNRLAWANFHRAAALQRRLVQERVTIR